MLGRQARGGVVRCGVRDRPGVRDADAVRGADLLQRRRELGADRNPRAVQHAEFVDLGRLGRGDDPVGDAVGGAAGGEEVWVSGEQVAVEVAADDWDLLARYVAGEGTVDVAQVDDRDDLVLLDHLGDCRERGTGVLRVVGGEQLYRVVGDTASRVYRGGPRGDDVGHRGDAGGIRARARADDAELVGRTGSLIRRRPAAG